MDKSKIATYDIGFPMQISTLTTIYSHLRRFSECSDKLFNQQINQSIEEHYQYFKKLGFCELTAYGLLLVSYGKPDNYIKFEPNDSNLHQILALMVYIKSTNNRIYEPKRLLFHIHLEAFLRLILKKLKMETLSPVHTIKFTNIQG
jgi:hypothetical protein